MPKMVNGQPSNGVTRPQEETAREANEHEEEAQGGKRHAHAVKAQVLLGLRDARQA